MKYFIKFFIEKDGAKPCFTFKRYKWTKGGSDWFYFRGKPITWNIHIKVGKYKFFMCKFKEANK